MNTFAQKLLEWHDRSARDLPWRGETDPYRIWISEIMLQQTRAETVRGYYHRFLAEFPDVYALATAPEDRVLKMWEGLGYYSRARNLMAAAKMIVEHCGGALPDIRAELLRLPGVGEYVSGAVASIAFGRREPALDGNQARVLSRIWDLDEVIRTPAQLYDRAKTLVPEERPGDYNQALMGLGALICLPRNPKCEHCPVAGCCKALQNGTQQLRPVKLPKREAKSEDVLLAVVCDEEGVLMRKRGDGLLAGMWEYPNCPGAHRREELTEALEEAGVQARYRRRLAVHKHVFTHKVWNIRGYLYDLRSVSVDSIYMKISWQDFDSYAVPTAFQPYTQWVRENMIK